MGQHYSSPSQPGYSNSITTPKVKSIPFFVFYDGAWWAMLCLALTLLIICALLAGLTLAVCGLNGTILQLRSITGTPKQRQQALVVESLKRHQTWMLCSLIICSVLCGESLPFVVQSLWDKPQAWVPIMISTLSIGLFAEISPQYFVPRHAIEWGYYCWPVIWGCMWISCILSWPIAKLLDYFFGPREELSMFSNGELAGLLRVHEKSENHGGSLGEDAARIMLGALSLDGHVIGANFCSETCDNNTSHSNSISKDNDNDLERAEPVVMPGMVVRWSEVKTVDINEPVDQAFIKKVSSWSYSRIPVVGEPQIDLEGTDKAKNCVSWDSKKMFGFLHIKNLLGLRITDIHDPRTGLFVRNLPLYPVAIVMDSMPIYSLLKMFELGMSRMAIVVRAPTKQPPSEIVIPKKLSNVAHFPIWTGTERTNTRIKSRLVPMSAQPETPSQYILDMPAGCKNRKVDRPNVIGIRCPEPLGIVTFEDIADAVLQKKSSDESGFYGSALPKGKKTIGYGAISAIPHVSNERSHRSSIQKFTGSYAMGDVIHPNSILRKRKTSNKSTFVATMDGVNENELPVKKSRQDRGSSSYTQNSQGGFHNEVNFSSSIQNSMQSFNHIEAEELTKLGNAPPSTPVNDTEPPKAEVASLPTRKASSPFRAGEWNPFTRRYVSAMPVLPGLRRVTPFSRQEYSSFDNADKENNHVHSPVNEFQSLLLDSTKLLNDSNELIMPAPSTDPLSNSTRSRNNFAQALYQLSNISGFDVSNSLEFSRMPSTTPFSIEDISSDGQEVVHDVRVSPYDGFPPELLDQGKENKVPNFTSRTMPRMMGMMGGMDGTNDQRSSETHIRESSFHDDRALLPSQRRALNGSASAGIRSASFWF